MLVDNPKILFKTLCSINQDFITLSNFKKKLENELGREKPIHIKTAHTYFYTATIYGLLIKLEEIKTKPTYRLSATAIYICNMLNLKKQYEYKEAVKTLILTNKKKGELFNQFLNYVSSPKIINDIYNKFEEPTGKTLIAWCLEAGLIVKHDNFIGLARKEPEDMPSIDEFWSALKKIYTLMQKTAFFGVKRIFIDLEEIRLRVLCDLGVSDPNYFDFALNNLLESEFNNYVTLDGAPSLAYDNEKYSFSYKGKNFLYISLGINK